MAEHDWHDWLWRGKAPRWYLLVVPIAVAVFAFGGLIDFLEAPLWVPVALILAAVPIRALVFQWWGRDCSQRQLHLRAAIQALLVTAVIYSTGWGPMLAVGYLLVAQEGVWASGSRAAWPELLWSLLALTAGQVALELGIAPSAVEVGQAHVIAALAAVAGLFGVFLMQQSASEREGALSQEQRARAHLSALLEQVPNVIALVDRSGGVRMVSGATDAVFGDPPDAFEGHSAIHWVHPDDRGMIVGFFSHLLDHPGQIRSIEHRTQSHSGQERSVHVTARNLLDVPEVDGVVAVVQDVTAQRRLEDERAALHQARENFLSIAAHEARTPLATLAGAARFLATHRDDLGSEETREALELIGRQGARLEELLDQLLEFSAVEAGAASMSPEPVELAPLVNDVVEDVPCPDGIEVRADVESGLTVFADPRRLGQVLTHLVINAYRYANTAVAVRGRPDGQQVLIAVADDGPGVPEELVPQLFQPFFSTATADPDAGVGLGLAISARVAAAHGATLGYEPAPDGGACFSVRFPRLW